MTSSSTAAAVLNFRKLKQELSASMLREGRILYEAPAAVSVQISSWQGNSVAFIAKVKGSFNEEYSCELEIFRAESEIAHSSCSCAEKIDCRHIACLILYLEEHFPALLVDFLGQKPSSKNSGAAVRVKEKEEDDVRRREAEEKSKEMVRERLERQEVEAYVRAGQWLANSAIGNATLDTIQPIQGAELTLAVGSLAMMNQKSAVEVQLFVKIPGRAKPFLIQNPKIFLHSVAIEEPVILGSMRVRLTQSSFGESAKAILSVMKEQGEMFEKVDKEGRITKAWVLPYDAFLQTLSLFIQKARSMEAPLQICIVPEFGAKPYEVHADVQAAPKFQVSLLKTPIKAIEIQVSFLLNNDEVKIRDAKIFSAQTPFLFYDSAFFVFDPRISMRQVLDLETIGSLIFPEALFTTLFAYTLPGLARVGSVEKTKEVNKLAVAYEAIGRDSKAPRAIVQLLSERDDELAVDISFLYGNSIVIPEIHKELLPQSSTVSEQLIERANSKIIRNFFYEKLFCQEITFGFLYDEKRGFYTSKSEKKIYDFFSETVASRLKLAEWRCDPALKGVFLFESSKIQLSMSFDESESKELFSSGCNMVRLTLSIEGPLSGASKESLLDAARLKKGLVDTQRAIPKFAKSFGFSNQQAVIPSDIIADFAELVQDAVIPSLEDGISWTVPVWVVFGLDAASYPSIALTIVKEPSVDQLIQSLSAVPIAQGDDFLETDSSRYSLRPYQKEGILWMRLLRSYGLSGVLADDMGLGKTLQVISLLADVYINAQASAIRPPPTLVVCPTSVVENWQEEVRKFEPRLQVLLFSGTPSERKRLLLEEMSSVDIIIASYGVVQREIEILSQLFFTYIVLDEAQMIKNRDTRNAKSVKQLRSMFRLALTGTPIENSLEDLWSLFDFLIPGFLGSFERFSSNYIKQASKDPERVVHRIRKKIQPFVLRRMKQDVLKDLPAITHHTFYSSLKEDERNLYDSHARRAREEIEALVAKEGFDKARLHVLATISRLKQICCHPRLIHKQGESSDEIICGASKYELLTETIDMLVAAERKTVIFSQYTRMLSIIREHLESKKITHLYLDGTTRNRLQLVKQFNEDPNSHVFLISIKAGGTGLNLTGADTVIHYDPWWNPAVENQATDRVWRMGQDKKVSSWKFLVRRTIEEKIAELQKKKKELITDVIQSDEEALSALTYDDVLELFGDFGEEN